MNFEKNLNNLFPRKENSLEILSISERRSIEARASFRRMGQKFKSEIINLLKPSGKEILKKSWEETLNQVFQEAGGKSGDLAESKEELNKKAQDFRKKAEENKDLFPNFSAYLFAQIAKMKESKGENFDDELLRAEECLEQSRDIGKNAPGDFLAEATLLGIQFRQIKKTSLPEKEKVAKAVMSDNQLLRDYALVLTESERAEFLNLISEENREKVAIAMDTALGEFLRDEKVLEKEEKEQKNLLTNRLEKALSGILANEKEERVLTQVLSQTLAKLGDKESQGILQRAGKNILENKDQKKSNQAHLAIILKNLAEADLVSGGKLTMEFLGQENLPKRYFQYFFESLARQGFLEKNLDGASNWPEEKCRELWEFLKKNSTEWQDEVNVAGPFQRGADIFGFRKMFKYAGRPDVTRHDALFAFDKILELQKKSGLAPESFFGNILNQVYNDDSSYEEGLSFHHLNGLANSLDLSMERLVEIKQKAGRYNISELKELSGYLAEPKNIFASWNNLKSFTDLLWLLEQSEILEELQDLEREAERDPQKMKLAKFIKVLAFHRDSKVDKKSIIEFWRNPENFLKRQDGHTTEEVQNAKKPSNYTEIPHLDLTASELRDAFVGGSLDQVQAFPATEITYQVTEEKIKENLSFKDELKRELGNRKDGTANKALFNEIRNILKEAGQDIFSYLDETKEDQNAGVDREELRVKIRMAMEKFPNQKISREKEVMSRRYRARVNLKSDPQAVLAGNDTACCMWFGSGKNNIYMFNPNCALFTLEEEKGNNWRTIAQSVLTLDQDIQKPIPEIVDALKNNQGNVSEILPRQVLSQEDKYLVCDNIELAGNAQGKRKIIEEIYSRFFEKYLEFFNASQDTQINKEKVIIGQGNSDIHFGQKEKNTFAPLAPVGYSDNLGATVDVIYFKNKKTENLLVKEEKSSLKENLESEKKNTKTGIQALTFRDALAVGYLEGKAYRENQSLITYLHNMENGLIAKDINNQAKNRPNLSFKYVDASGETRGYILAYEGRNESREPIIYVSDLASDRETKMAGGRLIGNFLEEYKKNYLDNNRLVPIFLQAREGTSYEIIENNWKKLSQKMGIKVKKEELGTYKAGSDTMHEMLLTPER